MYPKISLRYQLLHKVPTNQISRIVHMVALLSGHVETAKWAFEQFPYTPEVAKTVKPTGYEEISWAFFLSVECKSIPILEWVTNELPFGQVVRHLPRPPAHHAHLAVPDVKDTPVVRLCAAQEPRAGSSSGINAEYGHIKECHRVLPVWRD
eukprot:TRINITY_DN7363_c0_g1_i1.p3 TRINITY_DN7363_c0_g1~~TRINITY_DN7363_c0_g1_i1.p3  ORF type:complete len:151 (+),score=25.02 TRINITY_DN7363_c0_g1_i1:133-585(+)